MRHAFAITLLLLLAAPLSSCRSVEIAKPSTAPISESARQHAETQSKRLKEASDAAASLQIPTVQAVLADAIAEEQSHYQSFRATVSGLEGQIGALDKENKKQAKRIEQLQSASLAFFRWMTAAGAILLAVGIGSIFVVFLRPYCGAAICAGGSLIAVGIALQTIYHWIAWAALVALAGSVAAIIVQAWRHGWRPLVDAVRVAEIVKSKAPELAQSVYAGPDSIASKIMSPVSKSTIKKIRNSLSSKRKNDEAP